jgi:eukaryotic-like serine/threonine-protein kinase
VSIGPAPPFPLSRCLPGYKLDRYELLCPLAEGGMAQVWCARLRGKHGFEKLVAIKTILPRFAADPQFQSMFLDEARIASGIQHANVAQILDLGDEQGVLYIAMEWVDGDALTKLNRALAQKGQRIPMSILLRIVADTCGGLHAAHELRGKNGAPLQLVHRDVSPHNVLVDGGGVVKLIDFGIAKARDRGAEETSTGTLKGKIHYMAPEQATGSPVDRRADLWGIGAILYHYLAGRPPFDGPTQVATLQQLTRGLPPAALPATVPAPVAEIVMRALRHDREARQATAAEVQASIEAAMLSTGLVATSADVGAFVRENLGERAAKRKAAIGAALAGAEERERKGIAAEAVMPDHWISPEEKDRSGTPYSVRTEAALGVGSTIGPAKGNARRNLMVAVVAIIGPLAGIAASLLVHARSNETTETTATVTEAPASPTPSVASAAATQVQPATPPPEASASTQATSGAPDASAHAATTATTNPPAAHPAAGRPAPPPSPRPTGTSKIPTVIDNGF